MTGMLTVREACAILRISRSTLLRLIASGAIEPVRLSERILRFRIEDLERIARPGRKATL